MITPPINPQGDRLLLPDLAVEKLRKLSEARATAAKQLAREAVLRRLEWVCRTPCVSLDDEDRLVNDVLELVQTAVLTDRARQRDVLREVQQHLPAWAALGQAVSTENPPAQNQER